MMTSYRLLDWLMVVVISLLLLVAGCGSELALSSTIGGTVTRPGEGSFQYDQGSVAKIVATPQPDYDFVKWTGTAVDAGRVSDPKAPRTTVAVDADYTLQATFGTTLALKFRTEDSTTYRVIAEREKSVEFEGFLAEDRAFEGGRTSSRVDMTFTQEIRSVDDRGNATANITIKELKYLAKVKDVPDADFDSSREEDRRIPLMKLIGQSYRIKLSPAGEVIGGIDVRSARAAIRGRSQAHKTASALLERNAIKERHTVLALPAIGKNQVRVGDTWSNIKNFSYGLLGSETFERVYTLKELKGIKGHRLAAVEMKAIPSAEMAEELYKKQAPAVLPNADNTQTYTGQLELDLTAGRVEKCFEKLRTEWIIVDPTMKPGDTKGPAAVKMAEVRLYSLERID